MYYYASSTQQNTNATANTDTFLFNIHAIAGLRAVLRKFQVGTYVTPADNAVRLQLRRTATLLTAGAAFTPQPHFPDAPAANAVTTTLPTAGSITASPLCQLAYNQRGTAMWAAFNEDEGFAFSGATAPNGEIVVDSQSTGTSVPVSFTLEHSE